LACEDSRFGEVIQGHLSQFLEPPPLARSFDAVARDLGPTEETLLLLVTSRPADLLATRQLVQESALRGWPVKFVIVAPLEFGRRAELDDLAPYILARYVWPADISALSYRLRTFGPWHSNGRVLPVSSETHIKKRFEAYTPSLVPLAGQLAIAAAHDVTVLLTGETGTGKTHVAQMIHECSPRKRHGFMVVPCGALAANLIESELFGHVRGAFTGADRAKDGKFRVAGEGTLLLDEIDALGLEQQANLLRVLETGEFEPVGSNETQHCKARIIAASNIDLEDSVRRGRFRQDLFYRLNVMSFQMPALRERVPDIGTLARAMAARFASKFHKDLFQISREAITALEAYPWPGNIRQLENVVQQAVLVSTGPVLKLNHLPISVQEITARVSLNGRASVSSLTQHREARERTVIEQAIINHEYSRARAATALGISRVTLYKKMRKYGLLDMPRRGLDERPLGAEN
jgi:DNA-binding NtrC family response regulator